MASNRNSEQLKRDHLLPAGTYRRPEAAAEIRMADIWARALAVDRIGLDDDFFECGGDSLAAADIVAGLEREFRVDWPTHVLIDAPTVAALVARLPSATDAGSPPAGSDDCLFALPSAAGGEQIFLIPPRDDSAMRFRALAQRLGNACSVFGVVHPLEADFGAMVDRQLDAIVATAAGRPVHLVGICWGSLVALEMACRGPGVGLQVATVTILDPPPLLTQRDRLRSRIRRRVLPWLTLVPRRLATYRKQWSSLQSGGRAEFLRDKLLMFGRRLMPGSERRDLMDELLGSQQVRALTGLALAHQPRAPSLPVGIVFTRDRVRDLSQRSRDAWLNFLGDRARVYSVSGHATGDVLLNHLDEFASVVGQIVGEASRPSSTVA